VPPPAPPASEDERLPLIITGILIVELLTIVVLYWVGRYFTA
jgi:hypothetical protein